MVVLFRNSMTAQLLAGLLVTVFLTGCPDTAPKNDRFVLEVQFHQGKPPDLICTCSPETADGTVDISTTFQIDTTGTGNSGKRMVLGEGGRFTASFSSNGDEDSFTATIVLENTHQTTLVTKSSCALQTFVVRTDPDTVAVSVLQDLGLTIPYDAPLPAGKYTVTLTGKTPSGDF
jgi:hypothetical protein